jgi:acyl CoA:acetate/3-ketoacid CoA transferase beta subunit
MTADRAEICAVACAEAFRGDGEIIASPFGVIPAIGARLARHTFAPDLLLTDGDANIVAGTWAVTAQAPGPVESWMPYRLLFDIAWRGDRHVMMTPSQLDQRGNTNISAIGSHARPKAQLIGVRGAPGNTVSHPTSYWVPRHSPRVFVAAVDLVSGVGYDHAAELRRVISNLACFDWDPATGRLRLISVHPGVTVDEVVAATGFDLVIPDQVPITREPTPRERDLIREVIDPDGARYREVPA